MINWFQFSFFFRTNLSPERKPATPLKCCWNGNWVGGWKKQSKIGENGAEFKKNHRIWDAFAQPLGYSGKGKNIIKNSGGPTKQFKQQTERQNSQNKGIKWMRLISLSIGGGFWAGFLKDTVCFGWEQTEQRILSRRNWFMLKLRSKNVQAIYKEFQAST